MKLDQLKTLINAVAVTACSDEREITSGCACDLLSWVMAHGCGDMAWVTGTESVRLIAQRYGGDAKFHWDDGVFYASVILNP